MRDTFKKFGKSIFSRIVIPVILLTAVQSIIVILILNFTVIKDSIEQSQINNFKSTVVVRKNYFENMISNSWNNFDNFDEEVLSTTKKYFSDESISITEMLNDKNKSEDYLNEVSLYLIDLLNENQVTDAYFVLNNNFDDKLLTYVTTKKPKNISNDEVDILFAPRKVWTNFYKQGYGLNKNIDSNKFTDIKNKDFFFKTIEYSTSLASTSTGYWSCNTDINSTTVLTNSKVLKIDDTIVGVYGIGISEFYIKNLFANLNKGEEINIALINKVNNVIKDSMKSYMNYSLPNIEDISFNTTEYEGVYSFLKDKTLEYYYEYNLNIYENAKDIDEQWFVVGILPKNKIMKIAEDTKMKIFLIYGISFISILILCCIIAYIITRPIARVSNSISERNINNIPKTDITEVDKLINEINFYFNKTASLSNKLNLLVEDSTFNIAFFEYQEKNDLIVSTKQFYEMLDLPNKNKEINKEAFISLIKTLEDNVTSSTYSSISDEILKESGEIIFLIKQKYLRLKVAVDDNHDVFATLIDFTNDYIEKQKLVKERDFDVLTGLLNIRGFYSKVLPLFEETNNKKGSYFMIDVDNLKLINDQYGHEYGDVYLQIIGQYLIKITNKYKNLYACHISGDEYVLYLDGYDSFQEESNIIRAIENIKSENFYIKTKLFHLSFSMGICRNIKNLTFEELGKRADFAMYLAKRNGKNLTQIFDDDVYKLYLEDTVLVEDLNEILTKGLIDYAYQPIVDILTGEILGYEALMRPIYKNFNPTMVINAAKKYNQLYEIEKITMFKAPEKFFSKKVDKKIFLNSISSQVFNDDDLNAFKKQFGSHFDQLVIELIEEDFGQNTVVTRKTNYLDENHISYAIDDYGTGFNNIGMILSFHPIYIKIEGSLIRNIDKDEKKQRLAKSIVSYCSINNIKIIAESVETIEELKFVKQLGVDYVQGYLLAKPDLEIKELPQEKIDLLKSI